MAFYNPAQHPLLRAQQQQQQQQQRGSDSSSPAALHTRLRQNSSVSGLSLGSSISSSSEAFAAAAAAGGDEEWVLFSAGEGSSLLDEIADDTVDLDDDEDDGLEQDEGDDDDDGGIPTPGRHLHSIPVPIASTGYSFPQHDGNVSFNTSDGAQPSSSAAAAAAAAAAAQAGGNAAPLSQSSSSLASDEITARVNAWRLDHTEQLFRELRKLQIRHSSSRRSNSISSWGIPVEEEEAENDEYDADIDPSAAADDDDTESYSTESHAPSLRSTPFRLTERSLSHHNSMIEALSSYDAFSIINPVTAADNISRYGQLESQRQERVERQRSASSVRSETDTHKRSTSASNIAGDKGFWHRITRRVIHNIMGIDDEVLDVLFGERFIDSDGTAMSTNDTTTTTINNTATAQPPLSSAIRRAPSVASEKSSSILSSANSKKYWEDRLIARIGRELSMRYCKDYGSMELCTGLFV
ncbi:hypothetical protein BZA70DRAFT_287495 [Myxozyma melibiosi]|uniref:Uncharacterized protein n=1 Tax=Myxozyma melibiosi TaxID=54550 RepID=A0ABR1FEI5_9ASCO